MTPPQQGKIACGKLVRYGLRDRVIRLRRSSSVDYLPRQTG
jgi:hypothetical protein